MDVPPVEGSTPSLSISLISARSLRIIVFALFIFFSVSFSIVSDVYFRALIPWSDCRGTGGTLLTRSRARHRAYYRAKIRLAWGTASCAPVEQDPSRAMGSTTPLPPSRTLPHLLRSARASVPRCRPGPLPCGRLNFTFRPPEVDARAS